MCFNVTLHMVDLWQSFVCCVRSGVTQCTLFMVLYLCRMFQWGPNAVLWYQIVMLMRLLAVPQDFHCHFRVSVERSCWPCIGWCGNRWFQVQGQCLSIDLADCSLFVYYYFPFLFFYSMGWYCGAGVFGLIGCKSLFPSLALPKLFNNKNNIFTEVT